MNGTFLVQSGPAAGASPAAASKDGSSDSSDQSGGFASVLGQEDAAAAGGSQASASSGGAVSAKGHKAVPPRGFDPAHALLGVQGQPEDPEDAKLASQGGAAKGSPTDAPPVDLRADADRDRHAFASMLIPAFAQPPMPPPPPHVGPGNVAVDPRGADTARLRGGPSAQDVDAAGDDDASSAASASPESLPDATDGAAQAAGLATLEAPLPGGAHASASASVAVAAASTASAPDAATTLTQAAPPSASVAGAQAASAQAPVAPRPAAGAQRASAREAAPPKSAQQTSGADAPSISSTTRSGAGAQAGGTQDAQTAPGQRADGAADAANAAGRAPRSTKGSISRAGDGPSGGADRNTRARAATAGAADNADPTSSQDAQAADPTAPIQTNVTAAQGSVDDGRAKTVTVVTKATPGADASAAATSARLRDALASVTNHAVLRGPATGHIDVPDLGRIAVRAHTNNGSVDVDVSADHADTRAVLRGHVNGMTADLHQADVPVSRVSVERGTSAFGDSQGSAARDPGANRQDSSRDQQTSLEQDDEPTPGDTGAAKRVRIVL
jgi:hypothetical protein